MTWPEIADKEGRIYCQKENTWCAFTDMETGGCTREKCIKEERSERKQEISADCGIN